jgi:hypothetical protein
MGSGRGMSILLSKIGLLFASILPQEAFMPGSFPQIVQSQAKTSLAWFAASEQTIRGK